MRWWDFFVAAGMGKWEVWRGGVWYVFWSLGGCGFGVASADGMDGWSSCLEMENGEIYISIPAQTHSLSLSLSLLPLTPTAKTTPRKKKKGILRHLLPPRHNLFIPPQLLSTPLHSTIQT